MQKPALKARSRDCGPELLAALERLLSFPQNQDSTERKLCQAIRHAQKLVRRLRAPPKVSAAGPNVMLGECTYRAVTQKAF
jgi:hypothetical protein